MTHTFTEFELDKIALMKSEAKIAYDVMPWAMGRTASMKPASVKKSVVIAGGLFPSLFHNESVNDYDVFVLDNHTEIQDYIDNYYRELKTTSDMNIVWGDVNAYANSALAKNNMLRNIITVTRTGSTKKLQVILTKYKTREELIDHFDFTHCKANYYDDKFYISRYVYNCIRDKILIPSSPDRKPDRRRYEKFINRGYTVQQDVVDQPATNGPYAFGQVVKKALEDTNFGENKPLSQKEIEKLIEYMKTKNVMSIPDGIITNK